MELRCPHKLHAILRDGVVEFKCGSRFCGARLGVVVLHQFDIATGECSTRMYKDPNSDRRRKK